MFFFRALSESHCYINDNSCMLWLICGAQIQTSRGVVGSANLSISGSSSSSISQHQCAGLYG